MREDLLHYIWKYSKLPKEHLVTTKNEAISLIDMGLHNHLAGPDFSNARIRIGGQLWAGNVEIHLKSSDWFAHHHETDSNYNNVILHVVWEDDMSVFREDRSEIPTLELKNYIPKHLLHAYHKLFDKRNFNFINCEKDIGTVDGFLLNNWLERLFFERLESKSNLILDLLEKSKNDWERVLFILLSRNFGSKVNGDSFFDMARGLNFSIIRKSYGNIVQLESLLFGTAGLLEDDAVMDGYYINLKKEYGFLKNKFNIKTTRVLPPQFYGLRPSNFPTIRLSQLANLYAGRQNLFSQLMDADSVSRIYDVLRVSASDYWNDHYTFGKVSKKRNKGLGTRFIDLIIINTIAPLKFCYARQRGKEVDGLILEIISGLKKEENRVVDNFKHHGAPIENAMQSQAILQLYNEYCTENRCLQCAVGASLLGDKSRQ
ncbi:DUF2851 family protein [Flavobacteriaceae bacterium F89]|uniref:DUF2851 family protein n=1 Tax=Cerina litoralis TaxID=2874477 RepID=A0AAE3ESM6_9FLAO|nr:DUF2851 family protein [Cerina litoralis]MCG2459640.1 DUF2851 family protein [Cerina litoralis]